MTSRTSGNLAAEIERQTRELDDGRTRLAALEAAYDAAILAGDAEAKANEDETTIVRRTIRRAELRLEELQRDHEAALKAEREAEAQAKRAAATAAVDDILRKIETHYRVPGQKIAAFLREWDAANQLAREAGVPSAHDRTRVIPRSKAPDREETITVYVDEFGHEHDQQYPPGGRRTDGSGGIVEASSGRPPMPRQPRTKTITIRGEVTPYRSLDALTYDVRLPGVLIGDEPIWVAALPK